MKNGDSSSSDIFDDILVEDKEDDDIDIHIPTGSSLIGFTRNDDRTIYDPDFGFLLKTPKNGVFYSPVYGLVTLFGENETR